MFLSFATCSYFGGKIICINNKRVNFIIPTIWIHHSYKLLCRKCSKSISIQIELQHWGVELEVSMEGFSLDYFKTYNMVRYFNCSSAFYFYLSEDNNKHAPDKHAHMMNKIKWMNTLWKKIILLYGMKQIVV